MTTIYWRNLTGDGNGSNRYNYTYSATGLVPVTGSGSILTTDEIVFTKSDTYAISGSTFENVISLDSPVLWYKFNESSGTTCVNYGSAPLLNGIYTGDISYMNPPLVSGQPPGNFSMSISGSGYVQIPSSNLIDYGDFESKTVEMMFNADSLNYTGINFLYEHGDFFSGMSVYISGGYLFSGVFNGNQTKESFIRHNDQIAVGKTYYINVSYNGAEPYHKLYVDGDLSTQQSNTSTIPTSIENFFGLYGRGGVGAVNNKSRVQGGFINRGYFFKGRIDELTHYNVVLGESIIKRHAMAAKGMYDIGFRDCNFRQSVEVDTIKSIQYPSTVSFSCPNVSANSIVFDDNTYISNTDTKFTFKSNGSRFRLGRSCTLGSNSNIQIQDPFLLDIGTGAVVNFNFPIDTSWSGKDFIFNSDGSAGTVIHRFQSTNGPFSYRPNWNSKNIYVWGGRYTLRMNFANNNEDGYYYNVISGAGDGISGCLYLMGSGKFDLFPENVSGSGLRDRIIFVAPIEVNGSNTGFGLGNWSSHTGRITIRGKLVVDADSGSSQCALGVPYNTTSYPITFIKHTTTTNEIERIGGDTGGHFWIDSEFYAMSGVDNVILSNNTNFNGLNAYFAFNGFPISGSESYPKLTLRSNLNSRRFSYFSSKELNTDIDVIDCDFRYSTSKQTPINNINIRFISSNNSKTPSFTFGYASPSDCYFKSVTISGDAPFQLYPNGSPTVTSVISGGDVVINSPTIGINGNGKFIINSQNPIDVRRDIRINNTNPSSELYFNSINTNGNNVILEQSSIFGFIGETIPYINTSGKKSYIYGSGNLRIYQRSGSVPNGDTIKIDLRDSGTLTLGGFDDYRQTTSSVGSNITVGGNINVGKMSTISYRSPLKVTFNGNINCDRSFRMYPSTTSNSGGKMDITFENCNLGVGNTGIGIYTSFNGIHTYTLKNSKIITRTCDMWNYDGPSSVSHTLISENSKIYVDTMREDGYSDFTVFDSVPVSGIGVYFYNYGNSNYNIWLRSNISEDANGGRNVINFPHIGLGPDVNAKTIPYANKISINGNWSKNNPRIIHKNFSEEGFFGANTPQGDGKRYYQVDGVIGDTILVESLSGANPIIEVFEDSLYDKKIRTLISSYEEPSFQFIDNRTYWLSVSSFDTYRYYGYIPESNGFRIRYITDDNSNSYYKLSCMDYDMLNNTPGVRNIEVNGMGGEWLIGYTDNFMTPLELDTLSMHSDTNVSTFTPGYLINISGSYTNNSDMKPNNGLNINVYGKYNFRPYKNIKDINASGGKRLNIVRNKDMTGNQNITFRRPW
jgi:hypothetical protein